MTVLKFLRGMEEDAARGSKKLESPECLHTGMRLNDITLNLSSQSNDDAVRGTRCTEAMS